MKPCRSYAWALLVVGALLVTLLAALDHVVRQADAVATGDRTPWAAHLAAVDRAVGQRDARAALAAWYDAYLAALGARRWQGYADVADAHVRIDAAFGQTRGLDVPVRQLYLNTLLHAREMKSLDGVLRAAKGFADLGDGDVARHALLVADRLAHTDEARARVRESAARIRNLVVVADE